MEQHKISIIIPCLNEAVYISATLKRLQGIRKRGHEVIISDGGSTDNTRAITNNLVDHYIDSKSGRSIQMNTGADIASGHILCFLHADTIAPANIDEIIINALTSQNKIWGRFNIRLSGSLWPFRIIEFLINTRSCITGVASGDQGIFISKNIFKNLSGYANIPLMEDIEISKRLRSIEMPACIKNSTLLTSSRRWEANGIIKTVLLMWLLRVRYFFGTPASTLANMYKSHDSK